MAVKHPYVASAGPLVQTFEHLRRSFPPTVSSDTLKRLGVAPNNESYVLNTLRFLEIIDDEGNRAQAAATVFNQHEDSEFQKGLSELVKSAYRDLFSLHGENAWTLDQGKLISYFRTADASTDIVGRRQATTFQALSALSGKGSPIPTRNSRANGNGEPTPRRKRRQNGEAQPEVMSLESPPPSPPDGVKTRDIGLTVRIEINLPASGDQETYDRIFRSIRENLIDAD